jgi:hypothetical protein
MILFLKISSIFPLEGEKTFPEKTTAMETFLRPLGGLVTSAQRVPVKKL